MAKKNQFKDHELVKSLEPEISGNNELRIVRTFNAPKKLVYKAFIDPLYLQRWWGTYYCQKSVCKVSPTVGGEISIHMTMVGGKEVTLKGEFHELIENERLVFTLGPAEDATTDFNVVNLNTVVFKENNGRTDLILTVKMLKALGVRATSAFQGMVKGWPESLNKLEECLKLDSISKP